MKTTFIFTLLLGLGLLFSCQQPSSNDGKHPEPREAAAYTNANTINKHTFNTWRTNWKNDGSGYMDTTALKFFAVEQVDLDELASSNPHGAHFYIGLEGLTTAGHYMPHIMLVGLDSLSRENRNLILDYTKACPPECP